MDLVMSEDRSFFFTRLLTIGIVNGMSHVIGVTRALSKHLKKNNRSREIAQANRNTKVL